MSKNILLGVTGSIAASKTEILYKKLIDKYKIKVFSTSEGLKYLSKEFLNEVEVFSSWEQFEGSPHIDYARWADLIIIYPATANFLAKLNSGIADDLLLSTVLMHEKPIYIAPAMHEEMFEDKKTQDNINELSKYHILCGPRYGKLDIGDEGIGRLIEPVELIKFLSKSKETIVVTSGPTYELIDPVRVITNLSSGKQGRAIAFELLARGYNVIYLHSDKIPGIPHAHNETFSSSDSLKLLLEEHCKKAKYLYMVAAVSDFIPNFNSSKIDRSLGEFTLNLSPNIDIIKHIKAIFKKLKVIGFSAQMNDDVNYKKLNDKNCDFLVINNINDNYFGADKNEVTIIDKDNVVFKSDTLNKNNISSHIIDETI
tara:strand:- start:292 stop:1401 length:1110 start_codon:yes stop_codon:yes gene_type:complete